MNWFNFCFCYLLLGLNVAIIMCCLFVRDYKLQKRSALDLWQVADRMGEKAFWWMFLTVLVLFYPIFFVRYGYECVKKIKGVG
jgi:hypothetical protein